MTTVAFTGDVAFSSRFKGLETTEFIGDKIIDFLQKSDYVVTNLESPITDKVINSDRPLNHVSSPDAVETLIKINASVWNLNNNHITDCGMEGVIDTIAFAQKNGCKPLGVGRTVEESAEPLVIGEQVKVGILSIIKPFAHIKKVGVALSWDKEEFIKQKIAELKRNVKWIVIVVHGGEEFTNMPMPFDRWQYKKFLDWGADVVIAHHPHVVQNYETFGDKIIFYSLGNFIFDTDNQRNYRYTDTGILVKIHFGNEKIEWDYLSTKINRENQNIIVGDKPAIFDNIDKVNYWLLWPAAAKGFDKNDTRKKRTLMPRYMKMSNMQWCIYKLKGYRRTRNLIVLLGCI